ncbi:hypothetical protein ACW9IO_09350 [Pseudomonas azotoformans]
MTFNLKTVRLMLSGAILGVAVAGLLGFDTSAFGPAGVASVIGAGGAFAVLKSLAIV